MRRGQRSAMMRAHFHQVFCKDDECRRRRWHFDSPDRGDQRENHESRRDWRCAHTPYDAVTVSFRWA